MARQQSEVALSMAESMSSELEAHYSVGGSKGICGDLQMALGRINAPSCCNGQKAAAVPASEDL